MGSWLDVLGKSLAGGEGQHPCGEQGLRAGQKLNLVSEAWVRGSQSLPALLAKARGEMESSGLTATATRWVLPGRGQADGQD